MKGYGLPRNHDVGSPDAADIRYYGLATHVGRLNGRTSQRSSSKRATRRIWKRVARMEGKRDCLGGGQMIA